MTKQSRLRVVPCTLTRANQVVAMWHRHHKPSPGAIFATAVADENGNVRGVALVGRPVARMLDDGWTLEVNRVATDGCPNACSALYGAAQRMAKALGYSKLLTYIRADEPGTSVVAAGLLSEGEIRARSWNMPGRPRIDKTEIVPRQRWVARPTGPDPIELTWPTVETGQLELTAGQEQTGDGSRDCKTTTHIHGCFAKEQT